MKASSTVERSGPCEERVFGLPGQKRGSMPGQGHESGEPHRRGVAVDGARVPAEEILVEKAGGLERDAADHVAEAQRRACEWNTLISAQYAATALTAKAPVMTAAHIEWRYSQLAQGLVR